MFLVITSRGVAKGIRRGLKSFSELEKLYAEDPNYEDMAARLGL